MSITDFLNARITEDETLARAALIGIHGEHQTSRDYADYVLSSGRDTTETQDQFIATFWPARILAECEAKRAIVKEHVNEGEPFDMAYCSVCMDRWRNDLLAWPCPTIADLAAIYADHPDYQDEWKVGA